MVADDGSGRLIGRTHWYHPGAVAGFLGDLRGRFHPGLVSFGGHGGSFGEDGFVGDGGQHGR